MTMGGRSLTEIAAVGLLGLATTSSVMLGVVLGLYLPFPKKLLAGVLAFAAGSLIAALAIELGFEGAYDLVRHGASVRGAWVSIAGGFAAGAVIYYVTSARCASSRRVRPFAIRRAFWNTPWTASAKPSAKSSRCCRNATCCATSRPNRSNRCSIAFRTVR